MSCSPRTMHGRGLAALLATLVGLSVTASAGAETGPRRQPPGAAPTQVSSPWDEMDQEIEAVPCSPEDRQRVLELVVATILLRSPYETTPIVVKPPTQPKPSEIPPGGGGSTTPPPPSNHAPEPGTLLTGVVGSCLGLLAWARGRRKGQLVTA